MTAMQNKPTNYELTIMRHNPHMPYGYEPLIEFGNISVQVLNFFEKRRFPLYEPGFSLKIHALTLKALRRHLEDNFAANERSFDMLVRLNPDARTGRTQHDKDRDEYVLNLMLTANQAIDLIDNAVREYNITANDDLIVRYKQIF